MGLIKIYSDEKEAKSIKDLIYQELLELDRDVPRVIEDLIQQQGFSIHPKKLEIIERKKALRQKLSEV